MDPRCKTGRQHERNAAVTAAALLERSDWATCLDFHDKAGVAPQDAGVLELSDLRPATETLPAVFGFGVRLWVLRSPYRFVQAALLGTDLQ